MVNKGWRERSGRERTRMSGEGRENWRTCMMVQCDPWKINY